MKLKLTIGTLILMFACLINLNGQDSLQKKSKIPLKWMFPEERILQSDLKEMQQNLAEEEYDTFLLPSEARALRIWKKELQEFYEEGDPIFDIESEPKKWQNKSAVILARTIEHNYSKRYPQFVVSERTRIKLNDKAAVEEFSEFYFIDKKSTALRVIKPDGSFYDVNLDDAVRLDSKIDVPDRYYTINKKYYKLAIKGLEAGDILDMYYSANKNSYSFEPYIIRMSDQYPIVHQKIIITVFKKFYINLLPMNGAPDVDWIPESKDKPKYYTYEIESREIDEIEPEIYKYDYRSEPCVKVQVFWKDFLWWKDKSQFLGEKHIPKNSVEENEIGRIVSLYYYSNFKQNKLVVNNIKRHLAWHNKEYRRRNVRNKDAYVRDVYYLLRHVYGVSNGFSQNRMSSFTFVSIMKDILKSKRINSEIVAVLPRQMGKREDLLFKNELTFVLVVKMKNKETVIHPFDMFSLLDEAQLDMEGSVAFKVTPRKNINNGRAKEWTLPKSNAKDNKLECNYKINFSNDLKQLEVDRTTIISGLMKKYYNLDVLILNDFLFNDNERYHTKFKFNSEDKDYLRKLKDWKKKNQELRLKRMEEMVKNEFDLVEYKTFKLLSTGRYYDSTTLEYNETFTIEDLIKKAGDNYIFEVGKLIGQQLELNKLEQERESDIYIPFARTYSYSIKIEIPKKYKIEGIDKLNFSHDSEVGSFNTSASILGNELTVNVEKVYKTNYEPLKNWAQIYNLHEVVFDFTQSTLLIK